MKNRTTLNLSLTTLQIFFACTVLLPFTMTLGIVWLCQAYHRCLPEKRAPEEGRVPWIRNSASSERATVVEHESILLPIYLSA
jgi:hypothetical protein